MEVPPSAPDWPLLLLLLMVLACIGGRLEALDLSAGLLWGMLSCPRDAVLSALGSPFASSGGRDIPLLSLLFFFCFPFLLLLLSPLLSLPRSNVYSIISSAVGEGRARNVRARQLTPIDFRLAVLESARSVRLFPLAYIAIRLCCEWQTRRGR